MTRHDDTVALRHMRDHAAEAVAMAQGRQRSDLDRDRQFSLALIKLVEIVGEAAARLSAETRAKAPDVPWKLIIGTRNRFVHGYDQVEFDVLWRIVTNELPGLIDRLSTMISSYGGTTP